MKYLSNASSESTFTIKRAFMPNITDYINEINHFLAPPSMHHVRFGFIFVVAEYMLIHACTLMLMVDWMDVYVNIGRTGSSERC